MLPFLEPLGFFLSSALTLILVYYKTPISILQQIILILLIILLLSFKKLLSSQVKPIFRILARFTFLILSSLFVQILVISSGGFYSPFLILLHLYTLGVSFLLDFRASISFLLFSVAVLILNIILDPKLKIIFKDDPGSFVLYLISFMVIIPLAQTLMKTYHLKDTLSKILSENLKLGELRERSILTSLNEIVVVTDKNLKIISANDAFENVVDLSENEIINQNFLDKISLKDKYNNLADIESLSINNVLSDQTTHIVSGFYLIAKKIPKPKSVNIEVKPITGSDGKTIQLVFVISDPRADIELKPHKDLEAVVSKQNALLNDIKNKLTGVKISGLKTEIELLEKVENDLLIAQELEDHQIKPVNNYEDVAIVCKTILAEKQNLAQSLGVLLHLVLSNGEDTEFAYQDLVKANPTLAAQVISSFTVQINAKWFEVLIKKLLDLAIFLASDNKGSTIELSLRLEYKTDIIISIVAPAPNITEESLKELFIQYYGELAAKTNLRLASGLEGFIAKTVADQLNTPIISKVNTDLGKLTFLIKLYKKAINDF